MDYTAHVLWIAQNTGESSAVYQEVDSSRFEHEHTNICTYKLFVLVERWCDCKSTCQRQLPGLASFVKSFSYID